MYIPSLFGLKTPYINIFLQDKFYLYSFDRNLMNISSCFRLSFLILYIVAVFLPWDFRSFICSPLRNLVVVLFNCKYMFIYYFYIFQALIALFIAAASASAPLALAPGPLALAHAPLATSYAHTYRVAHSVHAPLVHAHAYPAVYPAAPAYRAVAHAPLVAPAHAPVVAPAHAPLSYGYAAPHAYARYGWAL